MDGPLLWLAQIALSVTFAGTGVIRFVQARGNAHEGVGEGFGNAPSASLKTPGVIEISASIILVAVSLIDGATPGVGALVAALLVASTASLAAMTTLDNNTTWNGTTAPGTVVVDKVALPRSEIANAAAGVDRSAKP
jgi:hypothetical protein